MYSFLSLGFYHVGTESVMFALLEPASDVRVRSMHFPHLDCSKVEGENKSQDLGRNYIQLDPYRISGEHDIRNIIYIVYILTKYQIRTEDRYNQMAGVPLLDSNHYINCRSFCDFIERSFNLFATATKLTNSDCGRFFRYVAYDLKRQTISSGCGNSGQRN
jgi:hypothetical protein